MHDHSVEQWVANSHIAIIGHHSQQETLCACTNGEEKELGSTLAIGDDCLACGECGQDLRADGRGVADV